MPDQTVYHAQSQCSYTGTERLHRVRTLPNGHVIRVYLDNFHQWRAVVFKSMAHHKGYAGLCLDSLGHVRHYECAPAMVAYNASQVLSSFLRSIDIKVIADMKITEQQIRLFIDGYLTAALWSSTDTIYPIGTNDLESVEGETVNLDDYEWASGEAEKLEDDCLAFITDNTADLLEYAAKKTHAAGYDAFECAGHDFWLTRNGHGAGFWDRGLGELGDRLSEASKVYGGIDLYLDDNQEVRS